MFIYAVRDKNFDYYDNCGNYVGNIDDYDLKDLLNNAYIEIEGE